ncbi:hypothetical protein SAMN04487770_108105 [Butyrivibrio sp. ob235]|uniref:hypothetical protein n=1 Tax=Butyrivibrio sp. ob235 TaxID=1761780 RepID=UPI0008D31F9B|nr:hypothetical protein [Butyrivibrio sp. ob235]SEL29994.1 hypothetical protein SAMN04487770_108105 [Butyrivibrio sp. ob235]
MKDNRYANIIVCYGDADRDILTKQIKMYRERYQSKKLHSGYAEIGERKRHANSQG